MVVSKKEQKNGAAGRTTARDTEMVLWPLLRAALRGLVCALIASLVLSLIVAAIAMNATDPNPFISPAALGILGLSSLLGGWVTYRSCRRAPLLCGALLGGLLVIVLGMAALCLPDAMIGAWSSGTAWGLRGGLLVFGTLGATLGSTAPRKKKKRKHK